MAMQNISTGAYQSGTPSQSMANQGWVPVADRPAGGGAAAVQESTRNVTPSMSLSQARSQADTAFAGLVSPMSLADIRTREAEQKATSKAASEAQFNPQIAQEQKTGMATVSTAEGVTGQRQGFNISTAESAFLAGTQQEVNQRVKYVEDQKASAIATGDLNAIQRADDQLQKLNDYNNQLTIAKANYALQLMSGNREQAQLELAQQSQALQAQKDLQTQALQKEELKLNAYKTALDTPVGQTFTVNGQEFVGLKNAAGIDPANISLSTDDKGYETGINKLTGEVIWRSKVPTGKTKTQASNVTVNLKQSAIGQTENQMWDPVSKTPIGTYSKNNQTGVFTFFNQQGQVIPAPASYTTIAPKAGSNSSIELTNPVTGGSIKITK